MAKAKKTCPSCKKGGIPARTRVCPNPNCGYEFYQKKKDREKVKYIKPTPSKSLKIKKVKEKVREPSGKTYEKKGVGKKECDKCGVIVGARQKKCPSCGEPFIFSLKPKNKVQIKEVENWRELSPGDVIKVLQGYGPSYINKEGREVQIGYCGIFTIKEVHEDGLMCFGGTKGNFGTSFVYLGEEKLLDSGTTLKTHRIVLVKKKEIEGI